MPVWNMSHRQQPQAIRCLSLFPVPQKRCERTSCQLSRMPVLYLGRNHDDSSGFQADRIFSFLLIPAASCRTDQDLAASGFGVMDMPVVAASRLKSYIGDHQRTLSRICQRIQKRFADKVLCKLTFASPFPNTFACSKSVSFKYLIFILHYFY